MSDDHKQRHYIADDVELTVTLDCESVRLTYTSSGTVFVCNDDNRGDTYEIPLSVWRLFNGMIVQMEGEQ